MNRYRRWYHCTQDDHGPTWVPERRRPRIIGTNEPPTPRLCVAPTIACCFVASLFLRRGQPVYVYQPEKPRRGINPGRKLVHDVWITREHWLIPPVTMVRTQVIPSPAAELYTERFRQLTRRGQEPPGFQQRCELYLHALACLALADVPPVAYDRRLSRVVREALSWHDAA